MDEEELKAFLTRNGKEPSIESLSSMNELLNGDGFELIRVRPKANNNSMKMMMQLALAQGAHLAERYWNLLVSKERSFITSDRPVTLYRKPRTRNSPPGIGVATADEIYYPLDPYKVLVLTEYPLGQSPVLVADSPRIKQINAAVAAWSSDWIIHHPKHDPLKGLFIPPPAATMEINGIPVGPDSNVWNSVRGEFLDSNKRKVISVTWGPDQSE